MASEALRHEVGNAIVRDPCAAVRRERRCWPSRDGAAVRTTRCRAAARSPLRTAMPPRAENRALRARGRRRRSLRSMRRRAVAEPARRRPGLLRAGIPADYLTRTEPTDGAYIRMKEVSGGLS